MGFQSNTTQHLSILSGTSNVTVYGTLFANRHPPWLINIVYLDTFIGDNNSIFGMKDRGGLCAINQPEVNLDISTGWWDLLANINIPAHNT